MSYIKIPEEPKKPNLERKPTKKYLYFQVRDGQVTHKGLRGHVGFKYSQENYGDFSINLISFLDFIESLYPKFRDIDYENVSIEVATSPGCDETDYEIVTDLSISWEEPEIDKEYSKRIENEKLIYSRNLMRYRREMTHCKTLLKNKLEQLDDCLLVSSRTS